MATLSTVHPNWSGVVYCNGVGGEGGGISTNRVAVERRLDELDS